MTAADAERALLNLPPDDPLAPAVRALVADRDSWRRQAERLERLIGEALRGGVAGKRLAGSGV